MKEITGIMYCTAHSSFALEGYDWWDICEEQYHNGVQHGDGSGYVKPCVLTPMFIDPHYGEAR